MSEEWTPWFEHKGTGNPCLGSYVQAEQRNGGVLEGTAGPENEYSRWNWGSRCPPDAHFIRYRIRRPRALLQLIEMVENLPAPAQPRVNA